MKRSIAPRLALALSTILIMSIVGCGSQVSDMRQQPPLYQVDGQAEVALVNIGVSDEVRNEFEDSEQLETWLRNALAPAFDGSSYEIVDRLDEGFSLSFQEVDDSGDTRRVFRAQGPQTVPTAIEEPLLLAMHVVAWSEGSRVGDSGQPRKQANAEVVYSLWSRSGEEIDTRRVNASVSALASERPTLSLQPDWPRWMHESWRNSDDYVPAPPRSDERLSVYAAAVNARAFAFPYGTRPVPFTAPLFDSGEFSEGIALMERGDWAGAYQSFLQVLDDDPDNYEALYNLAIAAEMQGDEETAIQHLQRALEISDRGMIRRHLDDLQLRGQHRVDITETVAASRAAWEQQVADAASADDTTAEDEGLDEQ